MSIGSIRAILPRNRFARGVAVLVGGTAAGQIIAVLAAPFLTRLYTPQDFGLLAVYAGLLVSMAVIASLRYQLAIPLPENDVDAAHVAVLSLLLVLGMTALTSLVILLFRESIAQVFNTPKLAAYLWFLPVGLLLLGIYQVFHYWAIRAKAFQIIARTKFTQAASAAGIQLGGSSMGALALVLGQIAGQAVGATSLSRLAVRRSWSAFRQVRSSRLGWAAWRYRRFPIFSSWGGLANDLSLQFPPIFLAASFGTATAGIYALTHRVGAIPMSLVGHAIASVLLANAAEARRDGKLCALTRRVHRNLAAIAAAPAMVLVLAGPELFAFAFGEPWREAGTFARWMTPWLYFQFTSSPLSSVFMVLEKQAEYAVFQVSLALSVVLGASIGYHLDDPVVAVAMISAFAGACYLCMGAVLFRHIGAEWWHVLTPLLGELVIGVFLVTPLLLAVALDAERPTVFAALGASMALICFRYWRLVLSQSRGESDSLNHQLRAKGDS